MSLLRYRGVVLVPTDFTLDWVSIATNNGLNLLGLHMYQRQNDLLPFLDAPKGKQIVERAIKSGMDVECEIHAMSLLLPREHFEEHPDWFRMDLNGLRQPDGNFCPANKQALEVVCENGRQMARKLISTPHRYYLWPDDGKLWCHCPECAHLSDSDQNVLVMNALLEAIRDTDPQATLACLAYHETLEPSENIKPADGLFLEWAPIRRCYRHAINDPNCAVNARHLATLRRLLRIFDCAETQVLEYWIDASLFARRNQRPVKVPFLKEVMSADVAEYTSLGVRSITSFGCRLDADYVAQFGEPPIGEYGSVLASAGKSSA